MDQQARSSVRSSRDNSAAQDTSEYADVFNGIVLLSDDHFDKEKLLRDLWQIWRLNVQNIENATAGVPTLIFTCEQCRVMISLQSRPVGEPRLASYIQSPFRRKGGFNPVHRHQAHIIIAMLPMVRKTQLEQACLFTRIMDALSCQESTLGIFCGHIVYHPGYYHDYAQVLQHGELPVWLWLWYEKSGSGADFTLRTRGMDMFGKEELELTDPHDHEMVALAFLGEAAALIIKEDLKLTEGSFVELMPDFRHLIGRRLLENTFTVDKSLPGEASEAASGVQNAAVQSGSGRAGLVPAGISTPGQTAGLTDGLSAQTDSTGRPVDEPGLLRSGTSVLTIAGHYYDHVLDDENYVIDDMSSYMESAQRHLIEDQGMDPGHIDRALAELSACTNMAFYLRWCIENDMVSPMLRQTCPEMIEMVRKSPQSINLRGLVRDVFHGRLLSAFFTSRGRSFGDFIHVRERKGGLNEPQRIPVEINSWNEAGYQQRVAHYKKEMVRWQAYDLSSSSREPSPLVRAFIRYMDCDCTYFPAQRKDDQIIAAWQEARDRGPAQGTFPLIVIPDIRLWRTIMANSDRSNFDSPGLHFNRDKVISLRQQLIAHDVSDGDEVLRSRYEGHVRQVARAASDRARLATRAAARAALASGRSTEEKVEARAAAAGRAAAASATSAITAAWNRLGNGSWQRFAHCGTSCSRLSSFWNSRLNVSLPVILAHIPVTRCHEIFAWLPAGRWGTAPDNTDLMSVSYLWHQRYEAVPAVIGYNRMEFVLPRAPAPETVPAITREVSALCPDLTAASHSLDLLAASLSRSSVWQLFWH